MILGVGIDLLNINRIEVLFKKFDYRLANKILAKKELKLYEESNDKVNFLAKRFCAKEALSKAAGTGIGKSIEFKDIIITKDRLGKPILTMSKKGLTFLSKHFKVDRELIKIDISISDEDPFVNSFVVISSK